MTGICMREQLQQSGGDTTPGAHGSWAGNNGANAKPQGCHHVVWSQARIFSNSARSHVILRPYNDKLSAQCEPENLTDKICLQPMHAHMGITPGAHGS